MDVSLISDLRRARVRAHARLRRDLLRPRAVRLGLQTGRAVRAVPNEELAAARLQRLLRQVITTVPYYRDLVQRASLAGELELASFPVMTKATLQKEFANLIARDDEREGLVGTDSFYITRTSGSTGATASHLKTGKSEGFSDRALLSRILREHGVRLHGEMCHLGLHSGPGQPMIDVFLMPPRGYVSFNFLSASLYDEGIEEGLAMVTVAKPDFLWGLPSRICRLGEIMQENGLSWKPRAILTSYEQLSDSAREMITSFFGRRPINVYGSAELGTSAWECPAGRLHFPMDAVVVEILDDDGSETEAGEVGNVVVTSLVSKAMPLVRYMPGDKAIPAETRCSCGRRDPSVAAFLGRELPSYQLRGGKTRDAYRLMMYMDRFQLPGYQVVQDAPGTLRVVVPRGVDVPPELESYLERNMLEFVGEPTSVTVEASGEFVLTPSGKRNPFVRTFDSRPSNEPTRS